MKNLLKISFLILLLTNLLFSCKKPQELHPAPYPEEGFYISGSSIYIDTMTMNASMDKGLTINTEGDKNYRDSLYVKFLFVSSSGNGFAVKGLHRRTWTIEG